MKIWCVHVDFVCKIAFSTIEVTTFVTRLKGDLTFEREDKIRELKNREELLNVQKVSAESRVGVINELRAEITKLQKTMTNINIIKIDMKSSNFD